MKKVLIISLISLAPNLYSQENKKTQELWFVAITTGIEYKENNNDQLTIGSNNIVPITKLILGRNLGRNLYFGGSWFNITDKRDNTNNILIFEKSGFGLNIGLTTTFNKCKIRNQLGYQDTKYSILNLNKDSQPKNGFEYNANRFIDQNDISLVYGFEVYGKEPKILNFMCGVNSSYVISKSSLLTRSNKERFSLQIYLGLSASFK